MTFSPWTLAPQPHLVGLGERVVGGQSTLYLSGKNYSDGWALAVSTDEGVTVTPVMSYDQVAGIKPCVQQLCLDTCNYEEMQAIWDTAVCAAADGAGSDGGPVPPRARDVTAARPAGGRPAASCRPARASLDSWWRPPRAPAAGAGGGPPRDRCFPSVLRLDSRGSAV